MRKLFAQILILVGLLGLTAAVQAAPSLSFDNSSAVDWTETAVADTATTYVYGVDEEIIMRGAPFQVSYLVPETTNTVSLSLIIEDYDTGARQTVTLTGTTTDGSVNAAQTDVTGKIFDGRVILRLNATFEEAKRFFIKVHYGN